MINGFYLRPRSILRDLEEGRVSLLDAATHDFLCFVADWRTAVAWACGEKIRALCPADINLRAIQRSLQRLEQLQWIKRFCIRGRRGSYPIVVGRYFVRDMSLRWCVANLSKTTDWRNVSFDVVTDVSLNRDSSVTEARSEPGIDVSCIQDSRQQKKKKEETPDTYAVCEQFLESWNLHCGELPAINSLTKRRRAAIRTRLNEDASFLEKFTHATRIAAQTPFLLGSGSNSWRASFDWMLKPDSTARILEGTYQAGSGPQTFAERTMKRGLDEIAAVGRRAQEILSSESVMTLPPHNGSGQLQDREERFAEVQGHNGDRPP